MQPTVQRGAKHEWQLGTEPEKAHWGWERKEKNIRGSRGRGGGNSECTSEAAASHVCRTLRNLSANTAGPPDTGNAQSCVAFGAGPKSCEPQHHRGQVIADRFSLLPVNLFLCSAEV